jgi:hypothetical protein
LSKATPFPLTYLAKFLAFAICLGLPAIAAAQTNAQIIVGNSKIDLTFTSAPPEPLRTAVLDWVSAAARAVTTYYGQFPVQHVNIQVSLHDGHGAESGHTFGSSDDARITVSVGRSSTASDLAREWLMTHEMVHLAFPGMTRNHHWLEEGLATYVEPIARARDGELSPEKVWSDMAQGMPQGLPQPGDQGLNITRTWANTYWGGARFCLLADIEIRKRTSNKQGLEDALRAILKQGGTIEADWDLSRVLEIGDRATGVPVLHELYNKMSATPQPTDLNKLWKDLGIHSNGGKIVFDDTAPLASIRKAITQLVANLNVPQVLVESHQ